MDIGGIDLLWFGQVGLLYVILRPTDPSYVSPQVGVGKEARECLRFDSSCLGWAWQKLNLTLNNHWQHNFEVLSSLLNKNSFSTNCVM